MNILGSETVRFSIIKKEAVVTKGIPSEEVYEDIRKIGGVCLHVASAKMFERDAADDEYILFYAIPEDRETYEKYIGEIKKQSDEYFAALKEGKGMIE